MTPLEEILPREKREAVRQAWIEEPRWYNPWLHLGATSVTGVGLVVAAALALSDVRWWQVAFGAGLLVLANAAEWRIHKSLLHTRQWFIPMLYDRHTPQHHVVFTTDDMALRSPREFQLVLIPPYALALLFGGLLPVIAALWFGWPVRVGDDVAQHNLAAVFTIVTMGYATSYEWLHLLWHVPEHTWLGRSRPVRSLARLHAIHHDPRLMQRWNFNVTLPLWDLMKGTYVRDRDAAVAAKAAGARG